MTAIDSKGLEFEDVVMAFDDGRKDWRTESSSHACLRLLREIYVAITRAKQRVVILIKNKTNTMIDFFQHLDCNLKLQDAKTTFVEFDTETSLDDWFNKGQELFDEKGYGYTSKCFYKAQALPWSLWAQARHLVANKDKIESATLFQNDSHERPGECTT